MRLLLSALLLLASGLSAAALPNDGRSRLHKVPTWDRSAFVYARYLAPSPCYRIAERRKEVARPHVGGMPPTTAHYTLVVEKLPGKCPRAPTVLQDMFVTYANAYDWNVELTFVDTRGRVLKVERLGVPGQ